MPVALAIRAIVIVVLVIFRAMYPGAAKPANAKDRADWHWIWPVDKVKSLVADQANAISFFCGGSRHFPHFIDWFDGVFVLDIDLDTLNRRLAGRPDDEFGGRPAERELTARVHATKDGTPKIGVIIDATAPLEYLRTHARFVTPGDLLRSQSLDRLGALS